jgi:hypothetical protein
VIELADALRSETDLSWALHNDLIAFLARNWDADFMRNIFAGLRLDVAANFAGNDFTFTGWDVGTDLFVIRGTFLLWNVFAMFDVVADLVGDASADFFGHVDAHLAGNGVALLTRLFPAFRMVLDGRRRSMIGRLGVPTTLLSFFSFFAFSFERATNSGLSRKEVKRLTFALGGPPVPL